MKIREIVERIRRIASHSQSKFHSPESTEQVAEGIVQYAQMIQHLKPGKKVILNVGQIANRFREEPHDVIKAFVLLQEKGKADLISKNDLWKMRT